MTFDPEPDDSNQPEPSNEQKQAIYVAQRAVIRAQSAQAEAIRKARQDAIEDAKVVAQVPDVE